MRADILIRRSIPSHVLSITIVTSLTTPCRIAITFATTGARIPLEATWIFHRSIVPPLIKWGPDVTRDSSLAPLLQYCRGDLSINFDFHPSEYRTRGKRVDKVHDSIKRLASVSFPDLYPAFSELYLGGTAIRYVITEWRIEFGKVDMVNKLMGILNFDPDIKHM